MNTNSLIRPIQASLIAFAIAAFLGLALRWAFVLDMPEWFNYRHIQHAHSHVALLGWLFGIFCLSIIHYFNLDFNKYYNLYWALQAMVIGMLVTFPVVGYASLSILFSTGHILLSYWISYKLWNDLGSIRKIELHKLFVKTGLFFMVLSTLGTWAVGIVAAAGLKGSAIYYAAIQFYLHFQFNGWFIFVLIGVFIVMLEKRGIHFRRSKLKMCYILLVISTILTYALAITWSTPHVGIFTINSVGVILQLLALLVFLRLLIDKMKTIKNSFSSYSYIVIILALIALCVKIIIQAIVVIPYMAEVSYTIRNFVIGFIHLLMLGCLSLFAFGCISQIIRKDLSHSGTWMFLIGVVSTEILLFIQGFMVWQKWGFMPLYYLIVGVASAFILLGIVMILLNLFKLKVIEE